MHKTRTWRLISYLPSHSFDFSKSSVCEDGYFQNLWLFSGGELFMKQVVRIFWLESFRNHEYLMFPRPLQSDTLKRSSYSSLTMFLLLSQGGLPLLCSLLFCSGTCLHVHGIQSGTKQLWWLQALWQLAAESTSWRITQTATQVLFVLLWMVATN